MSWAKIAPIFQGAVGGAIVITIAGFSWLGWVTGGTEQQEATEMADAPVAVPGRDAVSACETDCGCLGLTL